MESLQRLEPPRVLGKWSLLANLGEGGMATVHIASVGGGALQRLAAVKLLRANAPDHDYRTRFLDEAAVVVRLHHNNIADVREAGEVDGQLFIAMELVEGRDLADVWDRCAEVGRAFPVALAVYIVREILRGLHYAHTFPGLGLVHRDVSPSNILLDWAGAVRLADFGLATSTLKAADTIPGMVFGKVGYMAPEQATRGKLDPRADVYGCGVVLWELLTGRPLRETGTNTQAVAEWDAPPPSSRSSRIDPQLDAIVVKALQRDREHRQQSAAELLKELSGWIADHAPTTTQEVLAEFMAGLFDDARERDHAVHASLLAEARARAEAEEASVEATINLPVAEAAPIKKTGVAARVSDLETISPGTIIAERYRIEGPIGVGGMGTVFMGEHVTVGRKVAVKVLTHEWSRNEVVVRRFKEEARAASAAGHPNIVEVFDAGELSDGRLYLVMELLNGRSLFDEIEAKAPFPVVRACAVIRDVARAIRAAHRVGIIHRDLKPDNIMLVIRGDEERLKVVDFGISASATRTEEESRLTVPGSALGTPEYMAPEQGRGRPPTQQFDIYAIGVILYEMLAGQPPFVSQNIVEVLARKATEAPPPLSGHRSDIPPALAELCHACLATEPEDRPATADAFIKELDPLMTAMMGPNVDGTEILSATMSGPSLGFGAPQGLSPAELSRGLESVNPDATTALPPPPSLDAALANIDSAPSSVAMRRTPESGPAPSSGSKMPLLLGGGLLIAAAVGALVWGLGGPGDPPSASAPTVAAASNDAQAPAAAPTPKPVEEPAPQPAAEPNDGEPPEPPPPASDEGTPAEPTPPESADDGADDGADNAATPEPSAAAKADPSKTAACARTRADAAAAYAARKWSAALGKLGKRQCWSGSGRTARKKMQIKAYAETNQFAKCVKAGRGLSDDASKKILRICEGRVARGEG